MSLYFLPLGPPSGLGCPSWSYSTWPICYGLVLSCEWQGVWASGALTLTLPQRTEALLSGDTETDSTSFYDRVWAAIRDKYRSEVCGKRKGSGPIPNPSQKYHLPCWSPVLHGGQPPRLGN